MLPKRSADDSESTSVKTRTVGLSVISCVDWSERRPHIGGALGAALLNVALERRWVVQDLDSRALGITKAGHREMLSRFGVQS